MAHDVKFEKLWKDPKYKALHKRKDDLFARARDERSSIIGEQYPAARAAQQSRIKKLDAAIARALNRIYAYEDSGGRR